MVFRNMNEGGIVPDITMNGYLVETFGKLGKLEKVSAYAQLGSIKDAETVFRQMQGVGCVPNAATYSILLNLSQIQNEIVK
jgi:pentatricopeptide repeat protein